MKSKLTVPKRNPFVCLVLKKTGAGSHRKSNKALRRLNKIRDRSSEAEQGAFNTEVEISKFSGPTILSY